MRPEAVPTRTTRAIQVLERLIAFVVLLMLLFGISSYTRGDAFRFPWPDVDEGGPACEDCAPRTVASAIAKQPKSGHERGEPDDDRDDRHGEREKDDRDDRERAPDTKHGRGGRGHR